MTAPAIESGWAAVNGANLHYRAAGDGPPLLLLHAGICDSRMWDEQIGEVARTHRVLAPDFRGFGQSKMVAGSFAHRRDLGALMDHLGIARAILLGVSSPHPGCRRPLRLPFRRSGHAGRVGSGRCGFGRRAS